MAELTSYRETLGSASNKKLHETSERESHSDKLKIVGGKINKQFSSSPSLFARYSPTRSQHIAALLRRLSACVCGEIVWTTSKRDFRRFRLFNWFFFCLLFAGINFKCGRDLKSSIWFCFELFKHRWHRWGSARAVTGCNMQTRFADTFFSFSLCKLHRQQSLNSDITTVAEFLVTASYLLRCLSFVTLARSLLGKLGKRKRSEILHNFTRALRAMSKHRIKWNLNLHFSKMFFFSSSESFSGLFFFGKRKLPTRWCRIFAVWKIEKLAKSFSQLKSAPERGHRKKVWTFRTVEWSEKYHFTRWLDTFPNIARRPPVSFENSPSWKEDR